VDQQIYLELERLNQTMTSSAVSLHGIGQGFEGVIRALKKE
jgi:hypothetical protein